MSVARFALPAKRVAVVTGAARGIGRSVALRLARDGHDVALADLRGSAIDKVAKEVEALGRRSLPLYADVTREEDVKQLVDDAAEGLGSVDIMVANAGIVTYDTVLDTSLERFQEVMAVNAQGVFLCYKHAGLKMVEQGRGGRIIGACSLAGKAARPDNFVYSATKFAVRGMTQAAALELAKHNITVNAYAPGAIDTNMLREAFERYKDIEAQLKAITPVGRVGVPDEIASCVSWLTSEGAGFVTGQAINVNGGLHFD
ncbi:unnamed protein product [Peniophora sp. CBMAI 1063]|nr:unnamed protein product [Peniophora sp. CBMAI 1063]